MCTRAHCKLCGSIEDKPDSRGLCFFCFARCATFTEDWRVHSPIKWGRETFLITFSPSEPLRFENQPPNAIEFAKCDDAEYATPTYTMVLSCYYDNYASTKEHIERHCRPLLRSYFNSLIASDA